MGIVGDDELHEKPVGVETKAKKPDAHELKTMNRQRETESLYMLLYAVSISLKRWSVKVNSHHSRATHGTVML